MHACDHGILVKVLEMVIKLITIKGATTKREFDDRWVKYRNIYPLSLQHPCRWTSLLSYPGLRTLNKGVLQLKYIRAHEHRAIAIGLPYVLDQGLLPDSIAQECTLVYNEWRMELGGDSFQMQAPTTASERRGTSSVHKLAKLGSELQRLMNLLFRETSTRMSGDNNGTEDYGGDDDFRAEEGGGDITGFFRVMWILLARLTIIAF